MNDQTKTQLRADKQAADLAVQIKVAHKALIDAETRNFQQSLILAIELGVLLNQAKATVYHGHFKKWFEERSFAFSYRSANRYMKLAKNREKLEAEANSPRVANLAAEGELSIRGAEALLRPEGTDDGGDDDDDDASDDADASASAAAFENELEHLAPDEVCKLLVDGWHDDDKLAELVKLISNPAAGTAGAQTDSDDLTPGAGAKKPPPSRLGQDLRLDDRAVSSE